MILKAFPPIIFAYTYGSTMLAEADSLTPSSLATALAAGFATMTAAVVWIAKRQQETFPTSLEKQQAGFMIALDKQQTTFASALDRQNMAAASIFDKVREDNKDMLTKLLVVLDNQNHKLDDLITFAITTSSRQIEEDARTDFDDAVESRKEAHAAKKTLKPGG